MAAIRVGLAPLAFVVLALVAEYGASTLSVVLLGTLASWR